MKRTFFLNSGVLRSAQLKSYSCASSRISAYSSGHQDCVCIYVFEATFNNKCRAAGHSRRDGSSKRVVPQSEVIRALFRLSDGKIIHCFGVLAGQPILVTRTRLWREQDQICRAVITRREVGRLDVLANIPMDALACVSRVNHATHFSRKSRKREDLDAGAGLQRREPRVLFVPGMAQTFSTNERRAKIPLMRPDKKGKN